MQQKKCIGGILKEPTIDISQADEYIDTRGKTTIAPAVLLTITQLTALKVSGVHRMSSVPGGVNRFLQRDFGEGVRLDIRDNIVYADLYIILKDDVEIRKVSRQVQNSVARAISETVGMQVGRVNIHIEDIQYPSSLETDHFEES
jgi:uncharacterized alkaline shock family protein YloU